MRASVAAGLEPRIVAVTAASGGLALTCHRPQAAGAATGTRVRDKRLTPRQALLASGALGKTAPMAQLGGATLPSAEAAEAQKRLELAEQLVVLAASFGYAAVVDEVMEVTHGACPLPLLS